MDATRFDAFARELTRFGSRRRLFAALAGGGIAALLALNEAEVARKRRAERKKRRRMERRDRNDGRPKDKRARRTADGVNGRISNGTPVPQGKYPFAASIRVAVSPTSSILCSGSLIDPTHVLTAAHCTVNDTGAPYQASAYTVVVGQIDRTSTSCTACRKRVTAVSRDPEWLNSTSVRPHDVAVLTLDSAVDPAIARPIALVATTQSDLTAAGRTVTAAGWGITTTGGSSSTILLEATVPILDAAVCRRSAATEFCTAVVDGRDTCSGDSGAPLFVNAGGLVQVGVHSGGPAGCPSTGPVGGIVGRLSDPSINAFIRNAAPGAGPIQPPGPTTTPPPTPTTTPGPSDTTPPTVSASAPASVKRSQPFTISATATDSAGISKVELYNCTAGTTCTLVTTATAAPYGFSLRLNATGVYVFVARAFDTNGNSADSADVVVRVLRDKRKRR